MLNGEEGVEIYLEGAEHGLRGIRARPENAASARRQHCGDRSSASRRRSACANSPSATASAGSARRSAFRPTCRYATIASKNFSIRANPRYRYPYINCTNCGPRYTVVLGLPYDRRNTTMKDWPLDDYCAAEFSDPGNRRFHAQPVACPACGPELLSAAAGQDPARNGIRHSPRGRTAERGQDPRGERTGRISPGLRCPKSRGRGGFARAQVSQGKAIRGHGPRPRRSSQAGGAFLEAAKTLLTSTARPIVLAPAKV